MTTSQPGSGIVNIKGKQYKTVALRVSEFREEHKDFGLLTEVLVRDEKVILMRAWIENADGRIIAVGHASEIPGAGQINQTSALENCETSAIGRALASFGLAGSEFASANEVENAIYQQKATPRPANDPNRELTLDEKKALKAWVVNFRSQIAWTVPYEEFMTAVCRDSVGQDRPTTIAGVVKVRTNIDDMRYDLNTGERVDA